MRVHKAYFMYDGINVFDKHLFLSITVTGIAKLSGHGLMLLFGILFATVLGLHTQHILPKLRLRH